MRIEDLRYLRQHNPATLDQQLIAQASDLMSQCIKELNVIRILRVMGYPLIAALTAVWAIKDAKISSPPRGGNKNG